MRIGRDYFPLVTAGHVPALTGDLVDLAPSFVVHASELKDAVLIAPNAGTPGFETITIAGAYVPGDEVRITLTSNDTTRQVWRKSYTTTVVAGDTVTTIATRLTSQIATDGLATECPYTATNLAGVITVTQKSDDKFGLKAIVYTDSAAGTIVNVATPTVISEGQPSDLVDRGVDPSAITLGSYDTVRITYCPQVAQPFIDTPIGQAIEIFWYGTVGNGAGLVTLIQSL